MNKKIIKNAAVVYATVSLFAVPLFADSRKQNQMPPRNQHEIPSRPMMLDTAAHAVLGDWILRTQNSEIKIEIERDGEMEIIWKQGFMTETEWKGFWTATDSEITFTVRIKEVEDWSGGTKKKTSESMNAVWKIAYTRDGNTLTLNSSDLPKEIGGNVTYIFDYY